MGKIRKTSSPTTTWSGGTSTRLCIWPPASSYGERNFEWHISTATVEIPESEFTLLPGYSRIWMVLNEALEMIHTTPAGERSVLPANSTRDHLTEAGQRPDADW